MFRISLIVFNLLGAAALAFLLTACGGGGGDGGSSGSGSSGGGISLSITDAPVHDADIEEVWVRFTEVIVHAADGTETTYPVEDRSDPLNILPYRDIELKALVGGKTMLLGEIPLAAGDYNWLRLVIDETHTHIVETGGGDYLVKCPSCTRSGFKLNRAFTIDTTGWIDFIIDFDLRKSLTLTHPNAQRQDGDYILRPTLRILDTALASTYIHGIVTDQRTEQFGLGTPDSCWVYVYAGGAASIVPDDICENPDTAICPASDRPLLATPVTFDGGSGDYLYNTGYMYPGLYTVALVCEADDADVDEDLLFMSETEVQADAIPGGAPQDLAMADTPVLTLHKTIISAGSGSVHVGDDIDYEIILSNDGNITLTNILVDDPLAGLGPLDCGTALPITGISPAGVHGCYATYTVQPADTSIANTASASADQLGPVYSNTVTVDVAVP